MTVITLTGQQPPFSTAYIQVTIEGEITDRYGKRQGTHTVVAGSGNTIEALMDWGGKLFEAYLSYRPRAPKKKNARVMYDETSTQIESVELDNVAARKAAATRKRKAAARKAWTTRRAH